MRVLKLVVVVVVAISISLVSCSKNGSSNEKSGVSSGETAADSQEGSKMAVKVNGQVVSEQEVTQEENRLKQQLIGRVSPEQIAQMGDVIRKQAIENLINKVLLEQEVEKEKVEIDKKEIDARMEEVRKNFASEEEFEQRLGALGITKEELIKDIEIGLGIEALLDRETDKVEDASDSEVSAFYNENIDQFKQPERVRASHILIAFSEGESDSSKAEKKLRAAKVLGELKDGADFAQLAQIYSDCPSKMKGGDLGYFERGRMVKPFEDAAFALKTGEMSEVVETQFGYHIIKVTDHLPSRVVPLEEAKEDIRAYLTGEKKKNAVDNYINLLRAEAVIEWPDSASQTQE